MLPNKSVIGFIGKVSKYTLKKCIGWHGYLSQLPYITVMDPEMTYIVFTVVKSFCLHVFVSIK